MNEFVCEELNVLTRRLMSDIRQRAELLGRGHSARALASIEFDIGESNARFTEHRYTCPVCRNAPGPVLSSRIQ